MPTGKVFLVTTAVVLLGSLRLVAGHDHDVDGMDMDMSSPVEPPSTITVEGPASYFRDDHHGGWMYGHVVLMILAWCFVMPVSLMLSIARSRFHLPAQVLFHVLNSFGVFTSFVYNHSTPDLYKHNSHHPIGWVVTSFTIAWTIISFFVAYSEYKSKRETASNRSMIGQTALHNNIFQRYRDHTSSRSSRDSGQGTERSSASLMGSRQNSQDSFNNKPEEPESPMHNVAFDNDDEDDQSEKRGLLGNNRVDRFISRHVRRFSTPRASKILRSGQIILEKFLLLLGFLAGSTGFVIWGGIFREREIFSGLAHFVKGGIFFWYGLLTLGRWMGAFSEFGWAWNVRPNHPLVARWKTRIPSAEFVESFVIWLYGASNVFLEHLNSWGKAWSPQDFEHVSITILFFGGGLLGMMVESSWARELMNTTVALQKSAEGEVAGPSHFHASGAAEAPEDHQLWEQPKTYKTSLNPLPGLVIMLLGIMMSAHHQESMVSTMMHSQWGTLFVGFAMARAATYIILYIKPPTSHFPARPPSELVAAFCLTAGGLMFMFSARDVVRAIEGNGLDAMTIFTLTMGLAAAILAWEVLVFTLKGWAVRKERAAAGKPAM